jgi:DNA polymerase III alpha subunit
MLCLIAYQTAHLKANHPAEYMAAVLNNMSDIKQVSLWKNAMDYKF